MLAPEAISQRPADDRAGGDGEEEYEEKILGRRGTESWNFWDEEERVNSSSCYW